MSATVLGAMFVVAVVAISPSLGALGLAASLLALMLVGAALLVVVLRLLDDTGDEQ